MINISQEDVDFIMQEIQKNKLQKISKFFEFFLPIFKMINFRLECFQVSLRRFSFLDISQQCGRAIR